MEEGKIIEALKRSNIWWKSLFHADYKPREIYTEIKKFLPKRQILALVGLRRTGKTTIMLKIIEDLILEFSPEYLIYFSFDDFKQLRLVEVLQAYEHFMKKDMHLEKYLFLFDEIQKIEGWEEQLKRLYDDYPNIKFIISGSESLFIRKKSRESLAGRMYEFHIKTLSFKEFLSFKNRSFNNLELYKEEIIKEFHYFLFCNGFPEIINEEKEYAVKYIKENVIERIIYRDIPQIVSLSEPAILEQIFRIILEDPGEIINMDSLAKEIGIARQTISLYLSYLEKSFLVRKLYNYSKNVRKTQKRFKKYYPTIISPEIVDVPESFGKIFETFIINQLNGDFFWRDTFKHEVDLILLEPLTAIEIKSGKISEQDLNSLHNYIKKFKPKETLILSYNIKNKIDNIQIIPFYEYLL